MSRREEEEMNQEEGDMKMTDKIEIMEEIMEVIEATVEIEEILEVTEQGGLIMATEADKGEDTPEVLAGRL